ncbi:unnamed protein product [Protopolystoma xenopodis]|uniref:Uncharacterized protein n=1 Tax=Protopolystoma xenopodis TaxID=117903 RepID=A0A448X7M9_9PLAT|nr:unnamed protein product [Protopolystoma xenopodis]
MLIHVYFIMPWTLFRPILRRYRQRRSRKRRRSAGSRPRSHQSGSQFAALTTGHRDPKNPDKASKASIQISHDAENADRSSLNSEDEQTETDEDDKNTNIDLSIFTVDYIRKLDWDAVARRNNNSESCTLEADMTTPDKQGNSSMADGNILVTQ